MSEKADELIVGFGDIVDRIVSTPAGIPLVLSKGHGGKKREKWRWMKVYDETRSKFGRPLTLLAAEKLKENVGVGDSVILVTNSFEMDGPLGAATMARALIIGFNAIPIIVAHYEENTKQENCLPQAIIGAGVIPVKTTRELFEGHESPNTALVINWPHMTSTEEAIKASKSLLDEFNPKAVITVEAVSHNKKGIRHGGHGGPLDDQDERYNEILDEANKRGILTIATGDNGNEAGLGTIEDILKRHHVFCFDCGCPCHDGIVSASKADIIIPANSSNTAIYGIEACLAKILNKPDVMHDEYIENRMLLNVANLGINDGVLNKCTPTNDGFSHEACIYQVGLLRQTVLMSFVSMVRTSRGDAITKLRK